MPRLYKKTYTKPLPPNAKIVTEKGQRFAKFKGPDGRMTKAPLTKNGDRIRLRTKDWYARVRDVDGVVHPVKLCTNREAAEQRLAEKVREFEMGDRFAAHRRRPLAEHLEDYERALKAKGNTRKHTHMVCSRIRAVLDGCRFRFIAELSASRLNEWLHEAREGATRRVHKETGKAKTYEAVARAFGVSETTVSNWRKRGAPLADRGAYDLAALSDWLNERGAGGLSVSSSNHYLRAVKSFTRWKVRDRRRADDPLGHLSGGNAAVDRRHERAA